MAEDLGARLLRLAESAADDFLLVAPYIKVGALTRILAASPPETSVRVVTRWRIDEIAMGVSDLGVYKLLQDRGAQLWLHPRLHAKYYRGGAAVLIGSANLTDRALGWRTDCNLELLLSSPMSGAHEEFEEGLWTETTQVDDALYDAFVRALAAFPTPPVASLPPDPLAALQTSLVDFVTWRPQLRHPEDLWRAYSGEEESLTSAGREAAATDLRVLAPPPGLSRVQFVVWIGLQLRQHPEFQAIDGLLTQSRRFGDVRAMLAKRGAADAGRAWQSWMRWLLYFMAADYQMEVANYSEIFSRRSPAKPVE